MRKITTCLILFISFLSLGQNHSLNFDGVDDGVNLEQNFAFEATDAFTIEAWVNHDNQGVIQQIVAKLGLGSFSFRGWGLQILVFLPQI